jgi:hypothetical protein
VSLHLVSDLGVLATGDNRRLDALAAITRDALE